MNRWPARYPYVFVDGIYLKRTGRLGQNIAVMVAIGVNDDGCRGDQGAAAEGFTESAGCWQEFLSWLEAAA